MIDSLISLVAPHLCYSCGELGTVLCDNCKYNIISDYIDSCVLCETSSDISNVCTSCKPAFSRAFCVGERTDELRRIIDAYKFENVKVAYKVLAQLLSRRIGHLPSSITIVPIPTIPSHIRQRGYDHTLLIAKELAKLQKLHLNSRLLKRITNTQQRGASKKQRQAQAKDAFRVDTSVDGGVFLLIDDVITTGATVNFAAKDLLGAGADEVWVAIVAKQPI